MAGETITITTDDGFEVSSNVETADEMRESMLVDEPTPSITRTDDDGNAIDDPDAAPVAAKPAATPDPPKPDRRTREGRKLSIQQEIDELTTVKHQTKRELDADQAKLTALRSELSALEGRRPTTQERPSPPVAAAAPAEDPEPTIEQFAKDADPYTAWLLARGRWGTRQELRAHDEQQRQRAQATHMDTLRDECGRNVQERCAAYAKIEPNWHAKVDPDMLDALPLINLGPTDKGTYLNAIAEVVWTSDRPAQLLQACSEPDNRQLLSKLPPDEFYRAMGRIEARLEAASTSGPAPKSPPVITKAKALIKPVSSSPVVSDDGADDEDDTSEAAVNRHIRMGNQTDPSINPRAVRH